MAYELFTHKAIRTGEPVLTISNLRFHLNSDASEFVTRTGAKFVHILWDADAHRVAIRPTAKKDAQTYALTLPKEKRSASFSAQAFLRYIHWNGAEPCTVPVQWNEKDRVIEAVLPKDRLGTPGAVDAKRKSKTGL